MVSIEEDLTLLTTANGRGGSANQEHDKQESKRRRRQKRDREENQGTVLPRFLALDVFTSRTSRRIRPRYRR